MKSIMHDNLGAQRLTTTSRCARRNRKLLAWLAVGALVLPFASQAQEAVCGPEVKEAVAQELSKIEDLDAAKQAEAHAKIYEAYKFCIQDAQVNPPPESFHVAARQCGARVSQLGSTFYEEMSCCGYDPQRREFGCPVKIKQTFGFGGAPLPGSREYVLNCVADPSGVLHPVGTDSVHLANELFGTPPTWQFAVIAAATQNLGLVQPMNGATRRARSILSWGIPPNSCEFVPIWGNALNYHIRLDQ